MVIERWREYFLQLLNNSETQREEETINPEAEPYIKVLTMNEVSAAIRNLKNYKISKQGTICAELINYGGLGLWKEMRALTEVTWTSDIMLGE
jgi:hypothetical protein